jgi:putative endonuclease
MAYIRKSVLNTREIGDIGEESACTWLKNKGFIVIDRNYLKKWGEIDIVATKDKILHFVEVKSIILKGFMGNKEYRPEENVHELKVRRLKRVIQTYLLEKRHGLDTEFKFHIITVEMNTSNRRAHIQFMENIVL